MREGCMMCGTSFSWGLSPENIPSRARVALLATYPALSWTRRTQLQHLMRRARWIFGTPTPVLLAVLLERALGGDIANAILDGASNALGAGPPLAHRVPAAAGEALWPWDSARAQRSLAPKTSLELQESIRRWAKLVRGVSLNFTCAKKTRPMLKLKGRKRLKGVGYGTMDAAEWNVCYDGWTPQVGACTVASVGIGGEWTFEDGMVGAGCTVHAFDPTETLADAHRRHVELPHLKATGRLFFHMEALSGIQQHQQRNMASRYGTFNLSATHNTQSLAQVLETATRGNPRKIVDVLKVDCEGCEWPAFLDVARFAPETLARVRIILIEIHAIKKYGMDRMHQLDQLLEHLIHVHHFRVYKVITNKGWPGARNQIKPMMKNLGFQKVPCCYVLHLMRPPFQ